MGLHVVQGEGEVLGGFLFPIITMGNAIRSPTVKCFRFVRENLTTFPFGKRIVGKLDSWALVCGWIVQYSEHSNTKACPPTDCPAVFFQFQLEKR